MVRFTLLVVDCDLHTPRESAKRGMESILSQTFRDFEIVYVHDGFKKIPYEDEFDLADIDRVTTIYTKTRFNDWGHSLRRIGMQVAQGDYFVNFNIDNVLYDQCLQRVAECLDAGGRWVDVVIFTIVNYKRGRSEVLTGRPASVGTIDCLQLIASQQAWRSINYWSRTDYAADGHLYSQLVAKYTPQYVEEPLGENYQHGRYYEAER
jgi:hypothetical protein